MKARGRNEAPPQERPPQPGRTGAVILAIVVHAIFFALIVFGVTWQSRPEAPLVAELWSKLPSAPVKPVEPTTPPPEPQKPPEPEKPAPEPVKPPPEPPKPVEPPKPDPEIARKAEREKKEQLKREEAQREKERKEKADREKKEQEAKKKKEDDARKKKEDEKKKKEDDARKKEDERVQKEIQEARAAAASQRAKEIDEWTQRIRDKIRGRANIPDTVVGHPTVQVSIRFLPTGEVLDATITKSSGNPTYDAAIERAIRSASPFKLPPPNSELFAVFRNPTLNITHDR